MIGFHPRFTVNSKSLEEQQSPPMSNTQMNEQQVRTALGECQRQLENISQGLKEAEETYIDTAESALGWERVETVSGTIKKLRNEKERLESDVKALEEKLKEHNTSHV